MTITSQSNDRAAGSSVLSTPRAIVIAVVAVAAFQLAYQVPSLAFLMGVFAYSLIALAGVRSTRVAFYLGLAVGLAIFVPQLWFFIGIFKAAVVGIWLVAAVWTALFLLMARVCVQNVPRTTALLAMPILWTGMEYFRSELYYLRFSWVNIGYAFSHAPAMMGWGVYGVGFGVMLLAAIVQAFRPRVRPIAGAVALVLLAAAMHLPRNVPSPAGALPYVVGVQLERPTVREVVASLDHALARYPQADLMVLSEYTFGGPPPPAVTAWCAAHDKYLIAGGIRDADSSSGAFYNTAYVVGPDGRIAFTQGKSVPIQFFTDGLPAASQRVWDSPWGRIGLCVCYDLSYSRVTDELIRQGAGAIIVPTMDLISWGEHEHVLHALVGPTRAAEYGVPVVRVCSSGISQIISPRGEVIATAPFPGQNLIVAGLLQIERDGGHLPIDRTLAPACTAITGALAVGWIALGLIRRRSVRQGDDLPTAEKESV
jgi:apolipoprotein N-acyltransferase